MHLAPIVLSAALVLSGQAALADAPRVLAAHAERDGSRWVIEVTIQHDDSGWDHFADGFEVQAPDGTRLGYRELTRPHVGRRSMEVEMTGLKLPEGIDHVLIRTRCSLVGWAAEPVRVDLPAG